MNAEDAQSLAQTMRDYTKAFNTCAEWGFNNHSYNKVNIHNATYRHIRDEIPKFPSALVQCARDCACDALKASRCKSLPKRKDMSAMRYNQRVIRVRLDSGYASIATSHGRIRCNFIIPAYYRKYTNWTVKSSTLSLRNRDNTFYLGCQVESDSTNQPHDKESDNSPDSTDISILGIDRGIVNIAVCSDNTFYNSKQVKNIRAKYAKIRAELQSKGTRSATRKLRGLSGRERRFVTDVNHCISKQIVGTPYDVFAIENLTNIRSNTRSHSNAHGRYRGKEFARKLNNWAFYELEQFIRYKAESVGKRVVHVDARYTSQKCSKCGYVHKSNRNGHKFKCRECGFELHSDLNAARNIAIAGMSGDGRLPVNQPNVTCLGTVTSPRL
jgi:IS605 OrfB family transposase